MNTLRARAARSGALESSYKLTTVTEEDIYDESAVREGVRRHQDFELEKKDLSPTHFRMHRQI